jgi:hypothetical protein
MHPSSWIYRDLSVLDEAACFENFLHRPVELIPGTHVAVKHATSDSFVYNLVAGAIEHHKLVVLDIDTYPTWGVGRHLE